MPLRAFALFLLGLCFCAQVQADEGFSGSYRLDCRTIQSEPSAVKWLKTECERGKDAPTLRIEPGEVSGSWIVTWLGASEDGRTESLTWRQSAVDGMECVSAPFVAICKAPTNKAVFGQLVGDGVRSNTGLLLVGQGLIADVIKVNK